MRDELEQFEAVIGSLSDGELVDKEKFIQWKSVAFNESERIKRAFIKEAFGLKKEKHVELYIQYHQSAVVQLIDRITENMVAGEIEEIYKVTDEENRANLLKLVYQRLEDLLTYIEKHFAKYFNQHAKCPESYRFIVHRELKEKLPDVRYALEKKGINKRLLTIVIYPLDNFIEGVRLEEVSYKKIIYLKELLTELEELAGNRLTEERLDFKICLSLGYLNFNPHKFFKYCVREITRIVQDQETLSKQIEKLAYLLKLVNQVQCKPGFVFNEKFRSIKDQLSDWIGEEIYFFEKRKQLAINFPLNTDDPVQKDFKLKLNLSVPQLACFLRGLKDIGIIKNNNVLEVLRFIASIAQTKHTDSVSWESLRSKFYQADATAREGVKNIALELFNYMRKPPRP